MLSYNGRQILRVLMETPEGISAEEIQERFGIYRKNTYAEIDAVNAELEQYGARIKSVKGRGFQIEIFLPVLYADFREKFLYVYRRNRHLFFEKNFLAYQLLLQIANGGGT